ncbi:MAG: nitroreductase [Desulfobulbaceae bacterium]|nr:nitroreductase [Desulfobulbaceae bacterium]
MENKVLEAIRSRRSIREFSKQAVSDEVLREIISAGIWAPSGLNNQPWRFVLVRDKEYRKELASLTHYKHIILAAPALIIVYLDEAEMYDSVKDHQSAGACIQNMLLAAESLGLGAVWLGQILNNKQLVNEVLGLEPKYDLMAVLAVGHPSHGNQQSHRKSLSDFILKEIGGSRE